jgi:hypothetical protein
MVSHAQQERMASKVFYPDVCGTQGTNGVTTLLRWRLNFSKLSSIPSWVYWIQKLPAKCVLGLQCSCNQVLTLPEPEQY